MISSASAGARPRLLLRRPGRRLGGAHRRARLSARRLDDGTEHPGPGTRNRRLCFAEQFVEVLWISSRGDAETSPLRLDHRADWRATGACPFGICLRGDLGDHAGFWPHHPPYAPGVTMWIHHGDEAQPAVFGFDAAPDQLERFRPRPRFAATPEVINPGAIREVRLQLPVTPQAVLGPLSCAPCVPVIVSFSSHMIV